MLNNIKMNLLNKEQFNNLPKSQGDYLPEEETVIHTALYIAESGWTFYIAEFDSEKEELFGFVNGLEQEWRYYTLYELNEIIEGGWQMVFDTYFQPQKFSELKPTIKPLIERDSEGNMIDI